LFAIDVSIHHANNIPDKNYVVGARMFSNTELEHSPANPDKYWDWNLT